MMTFGPDSTAQRKPSTPDTSIAFSRPPSESRNPSSSSISWLVSGPIRSQSPALSSNEKLSADPAIAQCSKCWSEALPATKPPLDGNNLGAHPASRYIAQAPQDAFV